MSNPFEGSVAWITGGTSGIGRATALEFARKGAKLAVLGTDEAKLKKIVHEIDAMGREVLPLEVDVRDANQLKQAVDAIIDRWGRLDFAIINAGINGVWAPIVELTPEEWDETIEINLRGSFLALKYAVIAMQERGGSAVLVSSVNGSRIFSNSGASAYATSKAGQIALAKMAALELAQKRIRVNVICPGWIDTAIENHTKKRDLDEIREPVLYPEGAVPLTDGKPGHPEQVAQLISFLCSPEASHITGTEVFIDGGQSLMQG